MSQARPPIQPERPSQPAFVPDYATYAPTAAPFDTRPSFSHQAARASWIAPLVAIVINVITRVSQGESRGVAITVSVINGIIILTGLVLGIVALFGIRKYGPRKIRTPAVVGILINALILTAGAITAVRVLNLIKTVSSPTAANRAATSPAPVPLTTQQQKDSIEKFPGWRGEGTLGGAIFVLMTIDSKSPLGRMLQAEVPGDYVMAVFVVNNINATAETSVDLANGYIEFTDGSNRQLRRPDVVYQSAVAGAASWIAQYPNHFTVPAHQEKLAITQVFLPGDINLQLIRRIAFPKSGGDLILRGEYLTAEQ